MIRGPTFVPVGPTSSYWNKKHVSNFSPQCRDFGHCHVLREGGGRERSRTLAEGKGTRKVADDWPQSIWNQRSGLQKLLPRGLLRLFSDKHHLTPPSPPCPHSGCCQSGGQGRTDCFRHCVLHTFSATDNIIEIEIGDKFIWKKLTLFPDDLIMYPTDSTRSQKPSRIPKKLLQSCQIRSIQKSVYAPFTSNKLDHIEGETSPFII